MRRGGGGGGGGGGRGPGGTGMGPNRETAGAARSPHCPKEKEDKLSVLKHGENPRCGLTYLLRVVLPDRPGMLRAVATAIGDAGGDIVSLDVVERVARRRRRRPAGPAAQRRAC